MSEVVGDADIIADTFRLSRDAMQSEAEEYG
jgi:hypothetical protein